MAAQFVSGTPASIPFTGAVSGSSVVGDVDGAFTLQNSSADAGASVVVENLGGAGISLQAVGGGNISFDSVAGVVDCVAPEVRLGRTDVAGDATLLIQTQNTVADVPSFSFALGGTAVPGAPTENCLTMYSYVNGGFGDRFFFTGEAGAATPGHGTVNFTPAQTGLATIPLGASFVDVPLDILTANSIVLASISKNAAPDAALTSIANIIHTAGVGFRIEGNAVATTAAVNVCWWMPCYNTTV